MHRTALLALFIALALTGCSKKSEQAATGPTASSEARSENGPDRYMAYEHTLDLEVDEAKVASIAETTQATCRQDSDDACVVLASKLSTGKRASAEIKVRAKPAGVRKLIAALRLQGDVVHQATTAEDLASPIEDAAKKLAMLNDYRTKLEALRGSASANIDALIKVNKELAQTQSEIEAMTGQRAHLMQRVETETLTLSITTPYRRSFWHPIASAFAEFGDNLSTGVSSVITGMAFLLPWGLALLACAWGGRQLWRRWKAPA